MHWVNRALLLICASVTLINPTDVSHTLTYVDATHARLTWVALPESTYVNIGWVSPDQIVYVGSLTSGMTNTLTLYGSYPQRYIIEEYKLTSGRLDMIRLWSSTTIPTGTAALTPVPTITPTATPIPETPTPITPQKHIYIPIAQT